MDVDIIVGDNVDIDIRACELNGSYFEANGELELVERKMIGELDKVDKYDIVVNDKGKTLDNIITSLREYTRHLQKEFITKPKEEKRIILHCRIIVYVAGDLEIIVDVDRLKVFLATANILNFINFVQMDESCIPPPPKAVQERIHVLNN